MLTFFRRIRKRFLGSSQVGKYILYATGEILLVVAGILIALQINNWNETRKDNIIKQQYFFNLISDLDGQVDVCTEIIEAENRKENMADSALSILQGNDLFSRLERLDYLLDRIVPRRTFTAYDATFEDLKSSGNLKLIQDQKLRKTITDYYHHVENMSRVIALNNADLDANYKTSINQNKFGFYRDESRALKSDQLKDPVVRETLIGLIQQKKNISRIHTRHLNSLLKRTSKLQELLREAR